MKKIQKPAYKDVEKLRQEVCKEMNVTPDQWREKYLSMVDKYLTKDPRRYRNYGYMWWVVKKALLNAGYHTCGDSVDKEWFDLADYGNDTDNLLAAQMVYEDIINSYISLPLHVMVDVTEDDGETWNSEQFISSDGEAEIRAVTLGKGI